MGSLECCSRRGLAERFDSTIGAGTVLMPFGGAYQLTPAQCMAAKIPVMGETASCSAMSWGFEVKLSEQNPYRGGYLAVAGEHRAPGGERLRARGRVSELPGVFRAPAHGSRALGQALRRPPRRAGRQLAFGAGAIGGKDSMSGSFEELDVPPTLVSFAVKAGKVIGRREPRVQVARKPRRPHERRPLRRRGHARPLGGDRGPDARREGARRLGRGLRRHSRGPLQDVLRQPPGLPARRRL